MPDVELPCVPVVEPWFSVAELCASAAPASLTAAATAIHLLSNIRSSARLLLGPGRRIAARPEHRGTAQRCSRTLDAARRRALLVTLDAPTSGPESASEPRAHRTHGPPSGGAYASARARRYCHGRLGTRSRGAQTEIGATVSTSSPVRIASNPSGPQCRHRRTDTRSQAPSSVFTTRGVTPARAADGPEGTPTRRPRRTPPGVALRAGQLVRPVRGEPHGPLAPSTRPVASRLARAVRARARRGGAPLPARLR